MQYQGKVSASRQSKQEKAVWQRRFWEHLIRDEQDFNRSGDRAVDEAGSSYGFSLRVVHSLSN